MEQVKDDIRGALELFNTPNNEVYKFSKYDAPFLFGTENLEEINKVIHYNDKDVWTFASSGDHYISAAYYGAKRIDLYDINRLTKYVTYLKIAAIMTLSYEEFCDFYMPIDEKGTVRKNFWNFDSFKKVIKQLPADVAYFWENMIYHFKKKEQEYGSLLVLENSSNRPSAIKKGMPFYASEEEYYKLQAILRKRDYPEFQELDFSKLEQALEESYDVVYVSNIIDCMIFLELEPYMPYITPYDECTTDEIILKQVEPIIFGMLRENGTAVVGYRSNRNLENCDDFYYMNDYFEAKEVEAKRGVQPGKYGEDADKDIVLTYRPYEKGRMEFLKF